jgi:hypothetical protein
MTITYFTRIEISTRSDDLACGIAAPVHDAAWILSRQHVLGELLGENGGAPRFWTTIARWERVEHWSLTTLREKLVKIGARIVRHGRYVVFQLAEVAVPRALFAEILRRIERLRPRPPPFSA